MRLADFQYSLTNLKPVESSKITLTFPDGAKREFPKDITGLDIAKGISPSLAKRTVAMALDGVVSDLADPIERDANIEFIARDDARALELIRHDAAHVLAEAVQSLWPGTQVTIGPVIENGFYYDFFRNEPFTPEDFAAIEKKMREIIARDKPFTKEVWGREQTKQVFRDKGENFKVELVDAIPGDETDQDLLPGRLVRSLPRPAYDVDRQDRQGVQADEGRGRLLARRQQQSDADAHLRHRVRQTGRARRLSEADRGSRKARPSQARARARPVSFPGGRPGRGVLAPEGLDHLPGPDRLYAPAAGRRLQRSQCAADPRQGAVGDLGPLGLVPREHVRRAIGRRRGRGQALVCAEADELSGPCADFQAWPEKLSRPAAAACRIRRGASLRAVRARCTA